MNQRVVMMLFGVLWMGSATAWSQTPAPPSPAKLAVERPTTAVKPEGCVTEQCHGEIRQYKVLHGPLSVNACDACHTLADAEKHTFQFAREQNQICTFCHQLEIAGAKVVHEPLARGECLGCHNPHGGFDTNLLRSASMNDLCKTCHQDVVGNRQFVHGPVAGGACGACHAPHTAELPKLLLAQGRDLCLTCHQELGQQIDTVKFAHEPVKEDCQQCHDAHASDHRMMVRQAPAQLCTDSCHQEVKQAVFEAPYKHSAVLQDNACLNCHDPHGSDLATQMKDVPSKICLTCHREPIVTEDGRKVASVAEIADPALIKHGPVADGSCGGCHNVHGSQVVRLLNKPYPPSFYASFKVENYDLCFSCHDQQLALLPKTATLTGFRNGDVNLHFVHVNKDKRGRTCRACHSIHASAQEVHIRDSVPFGNWQLPINYRQTGSGGSCSPGCHLPFGYDRDQPVANATQPSASQSPAAPTAKEGAQP